MTVEARIADAMLAHLRTALAQSAEEHLDHTGLTCGQDYGRRGEKRRDDCCAICAAANMVMDAIAELV